MILCFSVKKPKCNPKYIAMSFFSVRMSKGQHFLLSFNLFSGIKIWSLVSLHNLFNDLFLCKQILYWFHFLYWRHFFSHLTSFQVSSQCHAVLSFPQCIITEHILSQNTILAFQAEGGIHILSFSFIHYCSTLEIKKDRCGIY